MAQNNCVASAYQYPTKANKKDKEIFIVLLKKIENLYKDVMKAFYNTSIDQANQVSLKRDEVMASIQKYIKGSKSHTTAQIAINSFNMATKINDISRTIRNLPPENNLS